MSRAPARAAAERAPAGLAARHAAVALLRAVLRDGRPLDEALERSSAGRAMAALESRDRAFARAIAATALRRKGQIDAVLARFLERGWPQRAGALTEILLAAAAQLLFLDTPPHAAVGLAVAQCQADAQASRYGKLANAVLRRVAGEGRAMAEAQDAPRLNTPDWLWRRWQATYGEVARDIARAHLSEPALDLTVKADAQGWARRLGGVALATGSVRVAAKGPVEALEGFAEGVWWVQDAAAALPARLLGPVASARVADLCAAPGGKTAQLAHAGAHVTAVDLSKRRLARVGENLARLGLQAELVAADATSWRVPEPFDAVLLDAPCSATGTIRRHPDILHLKRPKDVAELAALQARLIDNALRLLKPGGRLVYCTCSLEPEEGWRQVETALGRHRQARLQPVQAAEIAGRTDWIDAHGCLRTLPHDLAIEDHGSDAIMAGMDGFFAARLGAA